ncbi:MAG: hypothetical protein RLY97_1636 [Pseudomonadota bacterium]|jgi:hypothetical protein
MTNTLRQEIDQNFDYFRRNLGSFLNQHPDSFVLIRHSQSIDFFESPGEAYRAGLGRFPDELFSVQRVSDEPIELGHMSFAFD